MAKNLSEIFADRVTLVPFSTCHYWTGQVNGDGYGIYNRTRATHISHELSKGPVPKDIDGQRAVVRHTCDTPLCVNPDHLILGTQLQNIQDAVTRGRTCQKEAHRKAKLTQTQANEIVDAVKAGESVTSVAKRFGVSKGRVSAIRYGRSTWHRGERPTGRSDRRVSDEIATIIYRRVHAGERATDLAAEFGFSPSFVYDIKRGSTYASVTGHRG